MHYSTQCGRELRHRDPVLAGSSTVCCPSLATMGSDFYSCWVFWQDDVKPPPSEDLSGVKPPPPPPPLAQDQDHRLGQTRKPGREEPAPLSAAAHSGIVFSAPRNRSPPVGAAPAPGPSSAAQDSPSSPIYASISHANPRSRKPLDTHLALVNQHPIGPFPRVQSPPHLKSPPAETPGAGACLPPPPSPSDHPDPAGANQHFVLVEVHRPDSEPDVNEVRALPQTRSEYGCPAL